MLNKKNWRWINSCFPKPTTIQPDVVAAVHQLENTRYSYIIFSSDDADVPKLHTLHPVSTILILIYILVGTRYLYILLLYHRE